MMVDVKVPAVGESITEGILAEWLKADGDLVGRDEPLFVLETDKVTLNVSAERAGLLKVLVATGETVKVGQTVATLDTDAAGRAPSPAIVAPAGLPQVREKRTGPGSATPPGSSAAAGGGRATGAGIATAVYEMDDLSPAVRRMVSEFHLAPSTIPATGKGGRLTKEDVVRHMEKGAGSGERGAGKLGETGPRPSPLPPVGEGPGVRGSDARQTRTPMSSLRQRIAERLVMAQHTAAVLTTFNEADMSAVLEMRKAHGEAFKAKHGVALGFMSFFVKAAVEALKAVPALNAQIQGNEIVQNHFYDIGVAVSSDRGLSVPVIRDCDRLSFAELERAIADAALRVRERRITLAELTGGVFTVSNAGVFGGLVGTPILNPPQSGILGVYSIKRRPVAVEDRVEIRPMAYLALSYDHRLVDGKEAAQFLVSAANHLEHPESVMLEV